MLRLYLTAHLSLWQFIGKSTGQYVFQSYRTRKLISQHSLRKLTDIKLVNEFPGLENFKDNFTVQECLALDPIPSQTNSGHHMRLDVILLATPKSPNCLFPPHPVLCVAI
jgi:hypothetical protein